MKTKTILFALASLMLFSQACKQQSNLLDVVDTKNGKVQGVLNKDSSVIAFKGIPFAAPPVGDLRWKEPQAVENWTEVKLCDKFPASAMQATPAPYTMWTEEFIPPKEPISENCLYLNVWTSAKKEQAKKPVIVYIHGGAFINGSGSVPVYDGEEMAKKDVVFVTINYRIGIFGFFSHPELTKESPNQASGNYALLDQIAALKWVKNNIAAFGGDSSNVTIAGQSAGAGAVNVLMASPLAKGLFQRAIAQSGGALLPTSSYELLLPLQQAEQKGAGFAKQLGTASLADLKKLPATELLNMPFLARPIIDGHVLTEPFTEVFSEGKQNDVPLLLGWNADEGIIGSELLGADDFKQWAKKEYTERADEFLQLFPVENDEQAELAQYNLSALLYFGSQSFKWMQYQNKKKQSDVFMYQFTRNVPFGKGQKDYGAFHSSELFYAYKNLRMTNVRPWEEVDYKLAETMSSYWANFAKNGNPNGEGLPKWPACKPEAYSTMVLGDTQQADTIPELDKMQFLVDFYTRKMGLEKD